MILYRGDQKGNKTLPEKFATDGIFSKQLDSKDDPEPHKKYGWLNTIKIHIHVSNAEEKFIYDTTQYLSFSTDIDIVMGYLATRKKHTCTPTQRHQADAFLFTLEMNDSDIIHLGTGLFAYTFKCNYSRAQSDPKFRSPGTPIIGSCNICTNISGYLHQLLLIDAKTYLYDKKTQFPEAFENASRDMEWLIMPADPMVGINARGYQSKIPVADFWDVVFFKYDI